MTDADPTVRSVVPHRRREKVRFLRLVPSGGLVTLLVILLTLTGAYLTLRRMVIGRWFLPSASEYVALARPNQTLAQAICDYRADHGMLPQEFADLVPAYIAAVPNSRSVSFAQQRLWVYPDYARRFGVQYDFRPGREGWYRGDEPLPVVRPPSTRPVLTGETLVAARLAEYRRRIAADRPDKCRVRLNYAQEIAYLALADRRPAALAVCATAERELPDWWRPRVSALWLARPEDAASAEREYRAWADHHPSFARYWYLSRYYRERGRHDEAIAALREAAKRSPDSSDPDSAWTSDAYGFDAAAYACQQRQPNLVLDIADVWVDPYTNESPYAFRAAAELALGRFDAAKAHLDRVVEASKTQGLWAGHLDRLGRAVAAKDRTFVYDPGKLPGDWVLFPSPD